MVSIHAPAWGATSNNIDFDFCKYVSIHAPAWGATEPGLKPAATTRVSIHAPAWGATRLIRPAQGHVACFNPRSRMGSDLAMANLCHSV